MKNERRGNATFVRAAAPSAASPSSYTPAPRDEEILDPENVVAEPASGQDKMRPCNAQSRLADSLDRRRSVRQATMSVEEAAQYLGISRTSAYVAVRSRDIPAKRIGRRWIVSLSAIRERFNIAAEQSDPWK